ncbi:NUDIX domain-containing protein [Candidatus Woesearchaeota archaeon]|nr:NUDIX domain-containing protein [Candidatus Woesearchaeota archaeon]
MIVKVAIAVIRSNRLLLVRKRGLRALILPGGKPERGESRVDALRRELKEELDVKVGKLSYAGKFIDAAAGMKGDVMILLYFGSIIGAPKPSSEIKAIVWHGLAGRHLLSPVVRNKIIPFLRQGNLL